MTSVRLNDLKESINEKTPKQMRTIRNSLNNRIKSFEDEMKFGKALPKLSASHALFDLDLKDCKELRDFCMKKLKGI